MKDWKTICKKILYPPIWLMVWMALVDTVALLAIFIKRWDTSPIAYGIYVLSAYTLTVICLRSYRWFPESYRKIKQKIYNNKYGNRYMTDVVFKTRVSLYRSLTINLLYVAANVLSGYLYRTAWFVVLAFYYTILALMRFLLLRYVKRNAIGEEYISELRRSRLCAGILLTVNFALSGAVLMMMYQNKGYEYHGILIYIMAMYTFYITTSAIVNAVRYRKYHSPVMSTAKVITLAAALVSMLSLETAMLSQFATESTSPHFKPIMIAATGAGVSLVVCTMSIYMIVRATGEIKKLKNIGKTDCCFDKSFCEKTKE